MKKSLITIFIANCPNWIWYRLSPEFTQKLWRQLPQFNDIFKNIEGKDKGA